MDRKFLTQSILFICFGIFLFGCKKQNDDNCSIYTKAPVIEVNGANTALVNQEVDLTASFGVSNGCGQFDKFEEIVSGNTTIIALNAKYEGCFCTDDAPVRTAIYKFKKSQKGTYQLKFSRGDSYVTHVIIVQ